MEYNLSDTLPRPRYVIEGYFINILFVRYPELAGKFYHYLSSVLANRLNKREVALQRLQQQSTSEESSTSDDSSSQHKRGQRTLSDFDPYKSTKIDTYIYHYIYHLFIERIYPPPLSIIMID
jgi:hypothetical protein